MFILCMTLLLVLGNSVPLCYGAEKPEFTLVFDEAVFPEPYSGRVYLFFSSSNPQPRSGPDWFHPEPFVSLDVTDWTPGAPLQISLESDKLNRFPKNFEAIDLNGMLVQAVVRFNPYDRNVGTGVGNGFSPPVPVSNAAPISLSIQQRVAEPNANVPAGSEVVTIKSEMLSQFHGREVQLAATVTLPPNYHNAPNTRYPVIYEIPGFGGTHLSPRQLARHRRPLSNSLGVDFIKVMLNPECPRGHHVFANSANNGPYGDALVEELIPEIDRRFRTDARPYGRFLTGHSSGGWSSFWLQVSYPEFFGGTWSTAPDPVDFRDFQRINLYRKQANMFVDENQQRRPLARLNGQIALWYDDFSLMEDVLGYGGQLMSFEAVFSPQDQSGAPLQLWNRQTGEVDQEVAQAWKQYDINLILQSRWPELAPHLTGKLHIYMGDQDTFYLEGASALLKETLKDLGSDGVVTMIPGRNHFDLFAGGLDQKIEQEIAEQYRKHLPRE